jgi:hypothetical protein
MALPSARAIRSKSALRCAAFTGFPLLSLTQIYPKVNKSQIEHPISEIKTTRFSNS